MNAIKTFGGNYMGWSKEQLQEWGESCFIFAEQICKHFGIDLDFKTESGQSKLNILANQFPDVCQKQESDFVVVYAICFNGIKKHSKTFRTIFLHYNMCVRDGENIKDGCLHSQKKDKDDIVFFIYKPKK